MFRTLPALWLGLTLLSWSCGGRQTEPPEGLDGGSGDLLAPRLVFSAPAEGEREVSVEAGLSLEFSEPMQQSGWTVKTEPQMSFGPAQWKFFGTILELAPSTPWAPQTEYTVEVSGRDVSGNPLGETRLRFTTGEDPRSVAPRLVNSTPGTNATNVPRNSRLSLVFSKAMNPGTVQVVPSPNHPLGPAQWSDQDRVMSFPTPQADLAAATRYVVRISGEDRWGLQLGTDTEVSFQTSSSVDDTPPKVTQVEPGSNAAGVGLDTSLRFTFSEPMTVSSVEAAFHSTPAVNCQWSWDTPSTEAVCTPKQPLTPNIAYTLRLEVGATDVAGNALATPFSSTFTTRSSAPTGTPRVVSTEPAHQQVGVTRTAKLVLTFSQAMDPASVQNALRLTPGSLLGGSFSWDSTGTVMTYGPPADYAYGATVSWELGTAATDLTGKALPATVSGSFQVVRSGVKTLNPVAALDGHVRSTGEVVTVGAMMNVGDFGGINYARGFYTFDLSALPSGTTRISSATLTVVMNFQTGDAFSKLGPVLLEHVDYGPTLDSGDLTAATLSGAFTRPLVTAPGTGSRSLSVTELVADDWKNRATRGMRTQFRIGFSRPYSTDTVPDYVTFNTGDNNVPPTLNVGYEYP